MNESNPTIQFIEVFTTNKYVYETNQSIPTLRSKIDFVISQKEWFDFKYNLRGTLRSNNSFRLVRRAGFSTFDSWDREPVTIKGKLIKKEAHLTQVEIYLKPNFLFVFFSVIFAGTGIGALFYSLFKRNIEMTLASFGSAFFVLLLWFWAKYCKDYYQAEFERALDLPKNNNVLNRTIKL
jgi:hypothetical protein